MPDKPVTLPEFARNDVVDPQSNQNNVIEPSEQKKDNGWAFKEFPPRGHFNWLHRLTYQWLAWLKGEADLRNVTTDGNGADLFPLDNSLLVLYAVDSTTPANFIHAVGYRGVGNPTLNVLANNVLTLGAGSGTNQPISGGTAGNVIVFGQSRSLAETP